MEAALNQTAARLGQNFAEIESRRQELATMLDSMQEAVVAITPEGWSAGRTRSSMALRERRSTPAVSLFTSFATPTCWPACAPSR
jgi:hypothetical protein